MEEIAMHQEIAKVLELTYCKSLQSVGNVEQMKI
jgi:hypothetical protein